MLLTAWKFLKYDRAKSIGALVGVVISTFLIGQQSGIFTFLTNAMRALADQTHTDLWVVDNKTTNVNALAPLDIRKLREVASLPGVAQAHGVVIRGATAQFPNGTSASVLLVGSDPPRFAGGPGTLLTGSHLDLVPDGAVSYDTFDSKALGGATLGTAFELNGKRAYLAATTRGIRGFGGIFMFSTAERVREYTGLPATQISAVLVDLEPGADPLAVRDDINATLYGVRAWLPKDFSRASVKTVLSTTGIAISIGTLVIFATLSGFFIIGLTLYSAAIDRIKDYGTLKAIGATNGYVARLILLQALIFALAGFPIGYLLIEAFRAGIATAGTLFSFGWPIRFVFFGLTLFICLGGALFAVRRIAGVEPASVFRG